MFEITIFWIAVAAVFISFIVLSIVLGRLYIKLDKVEHRFETIRGYALNASFRLHLLYESSLENRYDPRDTERIDETSKIVSLILEEINDHEFET